MTRRRSWFIAAAFALVSIFGPSVATAQTSGTVSGRVYDSATNQPIAQAQVVIVGTMLGARSDAEGQYTIPNVAAGPVQVRVLRLGYGAETQPVTVQAGQVARLDFALEQRAATLDVVVTTVTGDQRRVEVGNSIAAIDAEQVVESRPVTSMGDLLTARAPGVQVLPSNQSGTGARVRIRGTSSLSLNNDPIYIIDGVRMESASNSTSIGVGGSTPSRVSDINPEDIASIDIVRGPSAATLYGTDAANGVIVITTKRGVAGTPRWTVYTEQGLIKDEAPWPTNFSTLGVFPNLAGDPTRADCYLFRQGLATTANAYCIADSLAAFNPAKTDGISPLSTGRRQQYGAQLSGGTSAIRYFLSGEWEDEVGAQEIPSLERARLIEEGFPIRDFQEEPNSYNRANMRANLNISLPNNLEIGVSTGYINSTGTLPQSDNNSAAFGPTLLAGPGLVDPDDHTTAYGIFNLGNIYQEEFSQEIDRFIGSTNALWTTNEWLTVRGNAGVDYTGRLDQDLCRFGDCIPGNDEGFKADYRSNFFNYTLDGSATGTFDLTSTLNSRSTVGVQFYRRLFDSNQAYGELLPPGAVSVSAGAIQSAAESTTETRTLGAFVEQSVAWNDRLFVTAGLRADDNSAFGRDYDAVLYPKLSVSWVVSDEPFVPRFDWLSQLRLRAAYGASGQQPGATDALSFFTARTAIAEGFESPGIALSTLGNVDLKPERSTEFEGGVDWTLLDGRVITEVTYYNKSSRDALVQRILPPSVGTGATNRFENLGEIRNWGWEWLVTAQPVQLETFGWDFTVNGSHNSNEIVDLGGVPPIIGARISQIEGSPLNAFYSRPILGFADDDNDGIIEESEVEIGADPVFLGYSTPRTEIAVTNGFDFWERRLRLSALVDYKGGHKVWNGTERYRCASFSNCQDLHDPNTSFEKQARVIAARHGTRATDAGYIEDASFVRLRELALNFSVPDAWLSRMAGAERVSLSLSARNLKIWTDYTGMDPESNYSQGDVQNDFLTLPPQRYYVLRLTVGL